MTVRILIVEDEPLLAMEIEAVLSDAGFAVAGVAGSFEKAMAAVAAIPCDAAILDANLRGKNIGPVADALAQSGTPFMFTSGYGKEHLPAAFADVPLLSKPFDPAALLATLRALLDRGSARS